MPGNNIRVTMFVSRKRRILNQIRNFLIILFLCWCYFRGLSDNAKPVERVTLPRLDDRPKFFAVQKSNEGSIKSATHQTNVLTDEQSTNDILLTSSEAQLTDDELQTTTDAPENSPLATNTQIDDKSSLATLEDNIMELYIKPVPSKATSAFGFNSTASDQKALLSNISSLQCIPRNQSIDLPTSSIIITFYNEHWTTLWVCWFLNYIRNELYNSTCRSSDCYTIVLTRRLLI